MKDSLPIQEELTTQLLLQALDGSFAHINPENVLEGLKLDYTGKKILNTPYTIWQCLKHINYWQEKFIRRLKGEDVEADYSWKEGWEEDLNASSQEELNSEVRLFSESLDTVRTLLNENPPSLMEPSGKYDSRYLVIQTMASHISYHIGEIVLLRRIFGYWPPKSGGMVW